MSLEFKTGEKVNIEGIGQAYFLKSSSEGYHFLQERRVTSRSGPSIETIREYTFPDGAIEGAGDSFKVVNREKNCLKIWLQGQVSYAELKNFLRGTQ